MKRLAVALGALMITATAHAEVPFAKERLAWAAPTAPFRIIGNVHYVGTADLPVYLITTPKGSILIEGGSAESLPVIEQNIAALGFKLSDIKLLIATHAHFDHVGSTAALRQKTGAPVAAMAPDKGYLEAGAITFGPSKGVPFDPVKVDRVLKDGEKIRLGGVTLTAHLTPGHTPGCASFTMPVKENGQKHKILFACSTSVAGNPLVGNSEYPGIVADYRRTFAKLKAMTADVFLTEHQGLADEIGKAARAKAGEPNPFVDAGELQRQIAASERDFDNQLAKAQTAGTSKN